MAQLRALISTVSAAAILVAVAVAPVAANTTTIDPASCTRAMRDTLNPDTGLPYCVKVALLRDGASSAPYYTNILPRRVFDNALLDANPTTAVSIESGLSDAASFHSYLLARHGGYPTGFDSASGPESGWHGASG